jgi:molybdenum cofactor cytidylyltransferase
MLSDPEGTVAGIILAAGPSTRMGENKLVLVLEGETVLARAVRRALAAGLDPVIVVLGHEANARRSSWKGSPAGSSSIPTTPAA